VKTGIFTTEARSHGGAPVFPYADPETRIIDLFFTSFAYCCSNFERASVVNHHGRAAHATWKE
jgi:hypothetical protein